MDIGEREVESHELQQVADGLGRGREPYIEHGVVLVDQHRERLHGARRSATCKQREPAWISHGRLEWCSERMCVASECSGERNQPTKQRPARPRKQQQQRRRGVGGGAATTAKCALAALRAAFVLEYQSEERVVVACVVASLSLVSPARALVRATREGSTHHSQQASERAHESLAARVWPNGSPRAGCLRTWRAGGVGVHRVWYASECSDSSQPWLAWLTWLAWCVAKRGLRCGTGCSSAKMKD